MEGFTTIIKGINALHHHPHIVVFCSLVTLSIICNGIMISYMGFSSFIDSVNNPTDYSIINHEKIIDNKKESECYSIIIQKQSHPLFSTNETDSLCVQYSNKYYSLHSLINHSEHTTDQVHIAGKVICQIKPDYFSALSCLWWQKTTEFVIRLKGLGEN